MKPENRWSLWAFEELPEPETPQERWENESTDREFQERLDRELERDYEIPDEILSEEPDL